MNNLEQGGFEEIQIPSTDLQGSGKWIQAGNFKATEDENAGTLTGKFKGHSIRVATVKGMIMELYELQFWIHLTDRFIKRKLILTRQNEKKVQNL